MIMINKLIINGVISSTILLTSFSVKAANISSGILRFTSNDPNLGQTSGTFEFNPNSSYFVEGQQVFTVSNINLTTPFGTNYSDDDILLSFFDGEPETLLITPVFSPSQKTLARLVIQLDFSGGGEPEEVLFFDTLDFQNPDPSSAIFTDSMSLIGSSYFESIQSVPPFSGSDRGTYIAVIPEPLTILGTFTALAFGTSFKRKLRNIKK